MDVRKAAELTKELMYRNDWDTDYKLGDGPTTYDHIEWMLDGIIQGYIQYEKAHRWLGWAQGVICARLGIGLDAFKDINKRA